MDSPLLCFINGQYTDHLIPILRRHYDKLIDMFNELYKNTYNNVHQETSKWYI